VWEPVVRHVFGAGVAIRCAYCMKVFCVPHARKHFKSYGRVRTRKWAALVRKRKARLKRKRASRARSQVGQPATSAS
jgi:hypothetical protein